MKIELYADGVLRSVIIVATPLFKGNNKEAHDKLEEYINTAIINMKCLTPIAEIIFTAKEYNFFVYIKARHHANKRANADSNR